jgi:hypothetical protein
MSLLLGQYFLIYEKYGVALIAQLDRASDFGPEG